MAIINTAILYFPNLIEKMSGSIFSIIDGSFENSVVTDKNGRVVFFPLSHKKGYFVDDYDIIHEAKKFYKTSFYVCFVILFACLFFWGHSLIGKIGSFAVCLGGWGIFYYLYITYSLKDLHPSSKTRVDITLELSEPDEILDDDFDHQYQTFSPPQVDTKILKNVNDPFLTIKRLWFGLSYKNLFFLYYLMAFVIAITWISIKDQVITKFPIDELVMSIFFFLLGLASFMGSKKEEIEIRELVKFLLYKAPYILVAIVFWSISIFILFKFLSLLFM